MAVQALVGIATKVKAMRKGPAKSAALAAHAPGGLGVKMKAQPRHDVAVIRHHK